jgi:hypothetical protein
VGAIRATIDAVDADRRWVDGLLAAQFTDAEVEIRVLERDLERGEVAAIDRALTYLEADPYYFRSGYARQRIGRKLAHQTMTDTQRARARAIVLGWVDGTLHSGRVAAASLARASADNSLRRTLRARVHDDRVEVARRALHVLSGVKRPGLSEQDVRRMRDIVLSDAGRFQWLSPVDYRAAMRLWSPEWRDELVTLTKSHGPDRKAAKLLLQAAERRSRKRTGP